MGNLFRSEWFWRMEEMTKRNGKGVWFREIEKVLKRFNASLEWLVGRIQIREVELEKVRHDDGMEGRDKTVKLKAMKMKSVAEVLEEVQVLIDTHFFDEFSMTKSSMCLKRVIENQSAIDVRLFKKTWRTLHCTPKTMKVIREIQESLLCVGRRKEFITKKESRDDVLVQQNRGTAECKAHRELLPKGQR